MSHASRLTKLERAAGPARPEEEIARDRELLRARMEWALEMGRRAPGTPWRPPPPGSWEAGKRLAADVPINELAERLRAARELADQRLREEMGREP